VEVVSQLIEDPGELVSMPERTALQDLHQTKKDV
jgi:hypothetical protein